MALGHPEDCSAPASLPFTIATLFVYTVSKLPLHYNRVDWCHFRAFKS